MAICSKCGQVMVKLEDGTYDCGCPVTEEELADYPNLDWSEEE